MGYREQTIKVSALRLDIDNARFPDGVDGQDAAIAEMLTNKKSQREILKLAQSIIDEGGLDPTQLIAVAVEDGQKVVVEGNRRLTTLKLLNRPSLAPTQELHDRFSALAEDATDLPDRVKAIVFDARSEYEQFQLLRHTGENGGAGLKPWRSNEVARFQERQGGASPIHMELLKWCDREYCGDAEMATYVARIRTERLTTLKRVLMVEVRPNLGLNYKHGTLQVEYTAAQLRPFLRQLFSDILDGRTEQGQPWSRATLADVKHYVQERHAGLLPSADEKQADAATPAPDTPEHEDQDQNTAPDPEVEADDQHAHGAQDEPTPEPANQDPLGPTPPNPPPGSDLGDRLFPGVSFDQFGDRTNAIGVQAKKFSINANAEACGVLCRVVVDLACTVFLERHDKPEPKALWQRVTKSLETLDPNVANRKRCRDERLHEVWKHSDHGNHGLAVETMNDFVHRTLYRNAPSEVRHINNLYTPMLVAMEANLRQADNGVATGGKKGHS
ncbi:hypothetical protein [Actinomyces ruminicola]|uniref:hypothetical protein n=1 Tax=Actinomyces ruminicola TaxID=332524 RepID=UPI0011C87864|nr:hypothetical protein [Actinomyces ruminicola]